MAKAPDEPSLDLYADLGVQFVDPSLRGVVTPEEMATQPTHQLLPAAQAGRVYPWEYVGRDHAAPARTGSAWPAG